MKYSRFIKYYIIPPFIILIGIILDYVFALFLSKNIMGYFYPDNDFLTFYETSLCTIIASLIPLMILYIQLRTSHNQFSYVQNKNDIMNFINISLDYLKIYNIDELKQLLLDWQYNHKSKNDLQEKILKLKDNADRIWLKLLFSVNQKNKISSEFISTQESNYLKLCEIYEDLSFLFCYTYPEALEEASKDNPNISLQRTHLTRCLKEKIIVKAVFQKYDLSYDLVKGQVFHYINNLKSMLNETYHIYGKNEDAK